jgi:ABC-type lipoprotein release transport system permease subunit
MSGLSRRLTKGIFLSGNSTGALIGSKLAQLMSINPGDSITVLGQGFHGVSAAAAFPVFGIVHVPAPELDSRMIYMPIEQAQKFFAADRRLTGVSLLIDDPRKIQSIKSFLVQLLPQDLVVKDWREMLPELAQTAGESGKEFMIGILYMIIALGFLGTALMMVAERQREFAILISVGMKRWRIILVALIEMVAIGFIGDSAVFACSSDTTLRPNGPGIPPSRGGTDSRFRRECGPVCGAGGYYCHDFDSVMPLSGIVNRPV